MRAEARARRDGVVVDPAQAAETLCAGS